jgi:diguanylate cyclase (GGDEF)-like protein
MAIYSQVLNHIQKTLIQPARAHRAANSLHNDHVQQLDMIYRVTQAVSGARALDDIYMAALHGLQTVVKVDRVAVLILDHEQIMRFKAWVNLSAAYRGAVEGHSPWAAHERDFQPILVSDVAKDPRVAGVRPVVLREGIRALAFIPLTYEGHLLGKFMIYYNTQHTFGEDEICVAQTIANQVAFAIERKQTEETLRQVNNQLTDWVAQLERHNHEISLLNEMGDLLQTSLTLDEAYRVIAQYARQLFEDDPGALYWLHQDSNQLELFAAWSGELPDTPPFDRDACWALRRGRLHEVNWANSELLCPHIQPRAIEDSLCVPIAVQGEVFGLLHLRHGAFMGNSHKDWERLRESRQRLSVALADHAGMALVNLKLRETLRSQAVRDPLTGLYNRRYLEETLVHELLRAERHQTPLGLMILDLDHFKQINDNFGHQAGDAYLQALGLFLSDRVRPQDIVCRYGGEEFVLILPDTTLTDAETLAAQLCQEIKHLHVEHRSQFLESVTASAGVAGFPEHGLTSETLLHAADQALYRAKAAGRNEVMTAHRGYD